MMRISIFLIFSFLCNAGVSTQAYEVDWGEEFRRPSGLFSTWRLAGLTDNSYHLIMQPRKDNTMLSFNLDHRLRETQSIEFQSGREDLQLADFIKTSAGTFAYFLDFDKRARLLRVFASPFDDGIFGEVEEVHHHEFRRSWTFTGFMFTTQTNSDLMYAHSVSADSSKVGFSNVLSSNDRGGGEALSVAVFDENFEVIWEKTQELEFRDQDLQVIQSVVSNTGELFLLGRFFDAPQLFRKAEDRGLPRYSYKVFRVSENNLQVFDVELEDGLAAQHAGLYMAEDDPDAFFVGGFYTTNERRSGLKGLFINKFSVTDGTDYSTVSPLDDEFLEGLISKADARKDRGLDSDFNIKNFLRFEDGSFGFIAENYYITTSYTNTPGAGSTTRVTYHTDELVIPRFDAAGELVNIQKIDKTFSSQLSEYTSYSLGLANGKVYLLYNDRKRGAERRALREDGVSGGYYTDMTVINETGEITYQETIFSSRDIDMLYIPSYSDYSESHLLISAVKGKRFRCGLIELE